MHGRPAALAKASAAAASHGVTSRFA